MALLVTLASSHGLLLSGACQVMTPRRSEIRRAIFLPADASTNATRNRSNQRSAEMGKIVVSTNVTLDGVVQDPDGQEDFRLGGWFVEAGGKDLEPWAELLTAEALGADAMLLGRRSD